MFLLDLVRCNWCDWLGLMPTMADTCPDCNQSAYLEDIRQSIEVTNSQLMEIK